MGVGKNYHPELDMKQQIHDIRAEWEEREAARAAPEAESASFEDDDSDFTEQVDNYFRGRPVLALKSEKTEGKGVLGAQESGRSETTTAGSDQTPNEKQSSTG